MAKAMNPEIKLDWADGEYNFALRWKDLQRLEDDAGCGAMALLQRLRGGEWTIKDVSDVMRNALIGGGLEDGKALKLVRNYVEGLPPGMTYQFALGLLHIGLYGPLQTETDATASHAPEVEN